MRTDAGRAALLAAALLTTLLVVAPRGSVSAQVGDASDDASLSDGHGERGEAAEIPFDPEEPGMFRRLKRLETYVMCACPNENWSRTLANCPDGCADPQKFEIRDMVREGRTDEQIFAAMEQKYGTRVRSHPGWAGTGKWAFILPIAGLLLSAVVAIWVVSRWQTAGVEARTERRRLRESVRSEDVERIERDLESLE